MSHGQKLPAVPAGSGVSASPEPAGLAAGKPFGLLRQRRDRQPESVRHGRGVWRGAAGAAAVRSADDDQTTGLRILRGVYSSRRIQQRLAEDIAFRVLAAGNAPNFRTISDFRKIHLPTLESLFEQILQIALEAGAMKLGRVALDGTKVKASASKHKGRGYARLKEKERQIRAEVRELLAQAEAADAEEDALYGAEQRGEEWPEELQRRETRRKKIREAKRALEARARQTAEKDGKPAEEV